MLIDPAPIEGLFIIQSQPIGDSRGWFSRAYCKQEFETAGLNGEWVQANQSFSSKKGTVRGLHFQKPPFQEIKLIRCIAGKIFDIAVDIRKGSPTFLHWFGVELSDENQKMLYVPGGFAHGFMALTDDVQLYYQVSQYYNQPYEAGLRYNDSLLNIKWPEEITEVSKKDSEHELLKNDFEGLIL